MAPRLVGVGWERGPGCCSSLVCKFCFFRIMECGPPSVLWLPGSANVTLHSSLEGFMIFQRGFEPLLWSTSY